MLPGVCWGGLVLSGPGQSIVVGPAEKVSARSCLVAAGSRTRPHHLPPALAGTLRPGSTLQPWRAVFLLPTPGPPWGSWARAPSGQASLSALPRLPASVHPAVRVVQSLGLIVECAELIPV